ncbi:MAG: hypothetical protein H0X26_01190 [Alphaproteobacteria bacterium]|nr:hypothetical protein [Alphaproteobacteria bacterium]
MAKRRSIKNLRRLNLHLFQTLFTQVQEPIEGDLAVYCSEQEDVAYDENGAPYGKLVDKDYHYGIYCADGRIESKCGFGPTYRHLPFYVPSSYGEKIKFYRLTYDGQITDELLASLSDAYVESLR